MKKIILTVALMHVCFLLCSQTKRTVTVEEAGTLHTLIDNSEKYEITDLTLTGRLDGDDVDFIRQMAGGSWFDGLTDGKLLSLNIENAMIVQGGSYKHGGHIYSTSYLEIGPSMFALLENLNSIILPASTREIANGAFYGCTGLVNIEIPDNTFSIDGYAFYECSSLESVTIGKNLEKIGSYAFSGCVSLKYFIVKEDSHHYKSINGVLFSKDERTVVIYPNAKSSEYIIPDNVKQIAHLAFRGCSSLEHVYMPNSVSEIGDYAFGGCKNLKTINISQNATALISTFTGCSSLTSITIPNSIQRVSFDSFYGCESLREIYCKNQNPPHSTSFSGINTIDCILYVPKNSYDAYSRAEGWRNFLNIIEKDFTSINNPNANFNILGSGNKIMIKSTIYSEVKIYSIDGKLIKSTTINPGENHITMNRGRYIVKCSNFAKKVVVR